MKKVFFIATWIALFCFGIQQISWAADLESFGSEGRRSGQALLLSPTPVTAVPTYVAEKTRLSVNDDSDFLGNNNPIAPADSNPSPVQSFVAGESKGHTVYKMEVDFSFSCKQACRVRFKGESARDNGNYWTDWYSLKPGTVFNGSVYMPKIEGNHTILAEIKEGQNSWTENANWNYDVSSPTGKFDVVLGKFMDPFLAQINLAMSDAGSGIQDMCFWDGKNWTAWETYKAQTTLSITPPLKNDKMSISVKIRDRAGHVGTFSKWVSLWAPSTPLTDLDLQLVKLAPIIKENSWIQIELPAGETQVISGAAALGWYQRILYQHPEAAPKKGDSIPLSDPVEETISSAILPEKILGLPIENLAEIYVLDQRQTPRQNLIASDFVKTMVSLKLADKFDQLLHTPKSLIFEITEEEIKRDLADYVRDVYFPEGRLRIDNLILDLAGGTESPYAQSLNIDMFNRNNGVKLSGLTDGRAAIATLNREGIVEVLKYLRSKGALVDVIHWDHFPSYGLDLAPQIFNQASAILKPGKSIEFITGQLVLDHTDDVFLQSLFDQKSAFYENLKAMGYEITETREFSHFNPRYGENQILLRITKPAATILKSDVARKLVTQASKAGVILGVALDANYLSDAYLKDSGFPNLGFEKAIGEVAGGWVGAALGGLAAVGGLALAVMLSPELAVSGAVAACVILGSSIIGSVFGSTLGGDISQTLAEKYQFNIQADWIEGAAEWIQTIKDEAVDVVTDIPEVITNPGTSNPPVVVDVAQQAAHELAQLISNTVTSIKSEYKRIMNAVDELMEDLQDDYEDILDDIDDFWDWVNGKIPKITSSGINSFVDQMEERFDNLAGDLKPLWRDADHQFNQYMRDFRDLWNQADQQFLSLNNQVNSLQGISQTELNSLKNTWNTAQEQFQHLKNNATSYWEDLDDEFEDYQSEGMDFAERMIDDGTDTIDDIESALSRSLNKASDIVENTVDTVLGWAGDLWEATKNVAKEIWDYTKDVAVTAWDGITDAASGIWGIVKNIIPSP